MSGTYQNGHISNFRVPLLFYYLLLPRIHTTTNASLSVFILPTILDLLVNTECLNDNDTAVTLDLINKYEGQSLILLYRASHSDGDRDAWNIGIINAGRTMLSVGSVAVPYRLILPLTMDFEYRFTHLTEDPYELEPLYDWTLESLAIRVPAQYGPDAADRLAFPR